jgi:hypothetical protein
MLQLYVSFGPLNNCLPWVSIQYTSSNSWSSLQVLSYIILLSIPYLLHTLKITGAESQIYKTRYRCGEKKDAQNLCLVDYYISFKSWQSLGVILSWCACLMWIQSYCWFRFIGSFLHALTFDRDRPSLHVKEDHATSMDHISFEHTHPLPTIIIIIIISVSLVVNISSPSTTT